MPCQTRRAARARGQVRTVDDCTAAGINEATGPQRNMSHDTVDALFEAAQSIEAQAIASCHRALAGPSLCLHLGRGRGYTLL